ncbi:MAG: Gfo/Idh/MocA family oxidoreductase [Vicinamibacterales bacterium]
MERGKSGNLRIAIVGCGQIADAHLQEIAKIDGVEAVAVCDREPDLAYQAAARFNIPYRFEDLERMLDEVRPDVVHITTPPHSHAPLAAACMRRGAHVYVEKPFAVDAAETRQVLELATAHNRLACVGHDHVFDPVWIEALERIRSGHIGTPAHIDSQQGYDPGGPFGRLIQTDHHHWIHRLPGGIFQNVISHAVSKVTPFLLDDHPETVATAFGATAEFPLPTELRVALRGTSVTAHITLLSRGKPAQRVVRIYGTRAGHEVDFESGIIRHIRSAQLPGAFGRIETPMRQALEGAKHTARAVTRFFRSDLHYFAGMRNLVTAFYAAVHTGGTPPIPYNEIQRVANIMDAIFQQTPCSSPFFKTDATMSQSARDTTT